MTRFLTAANLLEQIESSLAELENVSPDKLLEARYQKFRKMGAFQEKT